MISLFFRNFGKINNQSHSFNAIIRPLKDVGIFSFVYLLKSQKIKMPQKHKSTKFHQKISNW